MQHFHVAIVVYLLLAVQCWGYISLQPAFKRGMGSSLRSAVEEEAETEEDDNVLVFTDNALKQLDYLQTKQVTKMVLRMGVQAGGCSGMTYVMDFIEKEDITDDDHLESFGGVEYAIDPKSLMFLYGMQLDYSDELIGGGFKFENPNAETSCGCGKSFGV